MSRPRRSQARRASRRRRKRPSPETPSPGTKFPSANGSSSDNNGAAPTRDSARGGNVKLVLLLGVLGLLGVGIYYALQFPSGTPRAQQAAGESSEATGENANSVTGDPDQPPREGWVKVGGVWRPPTDIAPHGDPDHSVADARDSKPSGPTLGDPGRSPLHPLDENPHVRSVAAALRSGRHPERLSSFIQPKPFDKEAFLQDPQSYLETIEPGRVYQSAQPGEGVRRIRRLSPRYQRVIQGETVTFRVQIEPGMPVTFHSARLGQFENKLSTQTVRADDQGIAEVQFTATPGTRGDIDVLAASPTSSHQARFVVHVELPKGPPKVAD